MKTFIITGLMLVSCLVGACKEEQAKNTQTSISILNKGLLDITGFVFDSGMCKYESTEYHVGFGESVDGTKKSIRVYELEDDDLDQSASQSPGIVWEKCEVDVTNKVISFYKKSGRLICSLKFINSNSFKIYKVGTYLANQDSDDPYGYEPYVYSRLKSLMETDTEFERQ